MQHPEGRVVGSDLESFGGLSGDAGDEIQVLVEVQHRQPGQLGRCGDDQIGDGRRPVLALPTGTRLLAVSTVGAGDSASRFPRAVRMTVGMLLRNAIADHNDQERAIMSSDLDWTITRCVGPCRRSGDRGGPRADRGQGWRFPDRSRGRGALACREPGRRHVLAPGGLPLVRRLAGRMAQRSR